MSKMSRRTFLWLTGGSSFALASNEPRKLVNKLIPRVIPPEEIKPGEWAFFATTCRECPAGCGMHLWHRDGRVTKAEGNPAHPVNAGTLCPRGQSALQGLYDPDRLRRVLYRGKGERERNATWNEAMAAISAKLSAGGKVAVLSRLETGALAEVMKAFAAAFGSNRVLFYEAFNYEPLRAAHQQVFGQAVVPNYRLDRSDYILSLSADFLESWISPVSYARQFAAMHDYRGGPGLNRMVYVGPRLSMTAGNADTYLQVPPGQERVVAAWLLKIIIENRWQKNDISGARGALDALVAAAGPPPLPQETLVRIARAFTSAKTPVALAGAMGANTPMATDTAVCAALLNQAAGAIGSTVDFSHPHALSNTAREAELQQFFPSLGPNDVLFVHETNPAYSRPGVASLIGRAGTVVYLGTMPDETAQLAHWVLPVDYPLESWGEYEPSAGVRGLMQPTMGRLYESRAAGDILIQLARQAGKQLSRGGAAPPADFQAWLRDRWGGFAGAAPAEIFWTSAVRNGGAWPKAPEGGGTSPAAGVGSVKFTPPTTAPAGKDVVELWPWASVLLFDGRQANRGWIQETPDPMSFMVWGNWIDLHPLKAKVLGIADGDIAELTTATGSLRAPVRVTEEVVDGTAAIGFGQGHTALGKAATGVGANVFALLGPPRQDSLYATCRIRRAGKKLDDQLLRNAMSEQQVGREVLEWVKLSKLADMSPGQGDKLILPLPEGYTSDKDLYPRREYTKHRWAMVVDLHRCIGCGACTVACYAENNVAVIGKDKMSFRYGREMSWLRVAPYRKPGTSLRVGWLPLHCQHCDSAPCEPVCPVFAAVHNEEGLNAQIYNRCIGTRYCSNNCPYKVRRFNWINIQWPKPLDLQLNPEVTVRTRGVMEKCTFCVQRIRQAEYRAVREKRPVRDGEVVPACAQTCPTGVFTFGDLLDPNSRVSRLTRSDPRRYHLLEELNAKPGVTFLRRVDIDKEDAPLAT